MKPCACSDGSGLMVRVQALEAESSALRHDVAALRQQMVGLVDRVAAVEGRSTSRLSKADLDRLEALLAK